MKLGEGILGKTDGECQGKQVGYDMDTQYACKNKFKVYI